LLLIEAEKYFEEHNFVKAHEIIKSILDSDQYCTKVVPFYCAVLTELSKVGELYHLAHRLVQANPDSPYAWYSVGSYYFLIRKFDLARKYFNKANRLDKNFAASWIAFGHAFAAQQDFDQAMSSYRTADRLFPGCHQASLFIGMEYLRTNNFKTALMSFQAALKLN
jgi:anaphase-promoting complex subunit 6